MGDYLRIRFAPSMEPRHISQISKRLLCRFVAFILLESITASSSLDEKRLQDSDAYVISTDTACVKYAWFSNESESIAFQEPALLTNSNSKEDQTTTFADDYDEEIEIPEKEFEFTGDKSEDPLVKDTEKPLYAGARLTLGISMLLIVTFEVRHGLSGVALSDLRL